MDFFELSSLLATYGTFFAGSFLFVEDLPNYQRQIISVAIVLINAAFVSVFVYAMSKLLLISVRNRRNKGQGSGKIVFTKIVFHKDRFLSKDRFHNCLF